MFADSQKDLVHTGPLYNESQLMNNGFTFFGARKMAIFLHLLNLDFSENILV